MKKTQVQRLILKFPKWVYSLIMDANLISTNGNTFLYSSTIQLITLLTNCIQGHGVSRIEKIN